MEREQKIRLAKAEILQKLDESVQAVQSELHQRFDLLESSLGGLVPSTPAAANQPGPSYVAGHSGSSSGPTLSE